MYKQRGDGKQIKKGCGMPTVHPLFSFYFWPSSVFHHLHLRQRKTGLMMLIIRSTISHLDASVICLILCPLRLRVRSLYFCYLSTWYCKILRDSDFKLKVVNAICWFFQLPTNIHPDISWYLCFVIRMVTLIHKLID